MAKDKRSRRDKLKDGMLDKFREDVNEIIALNKKRVLQIENIENDINKDAVMIDILQKQIENIDMLCKKQDEDLQKDKTHSKRGKDSAGKD